MKIKSLPQTARPIYREMFAKGFGKISSNEVRLYHIIGEDNFRKIINVAFEHTYLEVRFLGISSETQEFVKMCKINRAAYVHDILKEVEPKSRHINSRPFYECPTQEELWEDIRRKYQPSHLLCLSRNPFIKPE